MGIDRLFDRVDNIKFENVTKKYDSHLAVDNINLNIEGGELLMIIGSSGSGKTTLIRMINKMTSPDVGKIYINNNDVAELSAVDLRRNIGYVIQNIGLFPHMTIKENIGLVAKLARWDKEKIEERVSYLLKFVSLPPELFIDRYPRQLSGGQQQRVGLARALMMDPPLLLMDEPFGALDPILRKQLQIEFLRIKKEIGRTIIFITHDVEEAFILGDRIAVMDNGKIIQLGIPEELIFNPENKLISEIVGSQNKFKHFDKLKVKDVVIPFEDTYFMKSQLILSEAIELMKDKNIEIGFVFEDNTLVGKIELIDLLKYNNQKISVKKLSKKIITFSPDESLTSALSQMKSSDQCIALVIENKKVSGVLMCDKILLKLI